MMGFPYLVYPKYFWEKPQNQKVQTDGLAGSPEGDPPGGGG